MKRIILFKKSLIQEGGAERLIFEVARYFAKFGYETKIMAIVGKTPEKSFGGIYKDIKVEILYNENYPMYFFKKIAVSLMSISKLRKEFRSFKPDIIVGQNPADTEIVYFASLGLRIPYATFLYASFFNFPDDGLKYLMPFKRVFEKIRDATSGHQTFIPLKSPVKDFLKQLPLRFRAWINYFVVRRAVCAFSMTRRMAWENEQLYHRPIIDIKSGVRLSFFNYKQKNNIRLKFGFPNDGKMLVDVSRLIPGKRIDLCVKTIAELRKKRKDIYFIVGGNGPEKEKLKKLINDLNLSDYVILAGFIAEEDLLDFYASADVIFHPAWIDFDLTIMEGLSLGKKIICSTDYDLSGKLGVLKEKLIFQAEPNPLAMARAVEDALAAASVPEIKIESILKKFTWEAYAQNIASHLSNAIKQ